jgi:membrane associated rhomboid family serine protease
MLCYSIWLSGIEQFLDTRIGAVFDDKLLLLWGSNYGPLTLGGQYWRVLTSPFVHMNAFHLGGNMLFLWALGKRLDRLVGRARMLVIYLLTGAAGSLASLIWYPTILMAGSSGAIYGLGGALIALLALAKLNLSLRQTLGILLWIVVMMPLRLLFGYLPKTNDYVVYANHGGGLVGGLAIGVLLAWSLRGSLLQRATRQRWGLAVTTVTLVVVFGGVIAIRYDVVRPYRQRQEVKAVLVGAQKELISKSPKDAAAHVQLAREYRFLSEYDEAAMELRLALEITPGDPDALSQLAVTYILMGHPGDAIPLFRRNLSQGPATASKYTAFSLLLEWTGRLNEAEEMARKAVTLDNRSEVGHRVLASVLSQLHKTEEAERERKVADQLSESH